MADFARAAPRYLTWAVLWVVVTAVAGAVTWTAVSWSGRDSGAAVERAMTPAGVRRALADLGPTMTTAPEVVLRPVAQRPATQRSPTPQPRPAVLRTHSWQVPGGAVAVACRSDHLRLLYASPVNGWTYRLGQGTGQALTVLFTGPSATSTLRARCEKGVPMAVAATSSSPSSPGSSDSEGGD